MTFVSPVCGSSRSTMGGEYFSPSFHSRASLLLLRRFFFILRLRVPGFPQTLTM